MSETQGIILNVIRAFCLEYVREPYLCYTEHGLHARFHVQLLAALPEEQRYVEWDGHRVCVVQKEYPTHGNLGKPQRQHWDIAVLKTPLCSVREPQGYDHLRLAAAIEFGMNATPDHLRDDLQRVSHSDANLEAGYAVHLYRLSPAGARVSGRDWSPRSKQILCPQQVAEMACPFPVEVYYGMADITGAHESGVWHIRPDGIAPIT